MSLFIIEHTSDGQIIDWRYEPNEEYTPAGNEWAADSGEIDHRELGSKELDLSGDTPQLVEKPNHVPPEAVDRANVSHETKQAFRDARATANLEESTQQQLDILFEILTGENP